MITINNDLQLSVSNYPVATNEVGAFCRRLDQSLAHTNSTEVLLPPEKMTLDFTHAGKRYQILFMQLTRLGARAKKSGATTYRTCGENYLLFEE